MMKSLVGSKGLDKMQKPNIREGIFTEINQNLLIIDHSGSIQSENNAVMNLIDEFNSEHISNGGIIITFTDSAKIFTVQTGTSVTEFRNFINANHRKSTTKPSFAIKALNNLSNQSILNNLQIIHIFTDGELDQGEEFANFTKELLKLQNNHPQIKVQINLVLSDSKVFGVDNAKSSPVLFSFFNTFTKDQALSRMLHSFTLITSKGQTLLWDCPQEIGEIVIDGVVFTKDSDPKEIARLIKRKLDEADAANDQERTLDLIRIIVECIVLFGQRAEPLFIEVCFERNSNLYRLIIRPILNSREGFETREESQRKTFQQNFEISKNPFNDLNDDTYLALSLIGGQIYVAIISKTNAMYSIEGFNAFAVDSDGSPYVVVPTSAKTTAMLSGALRIILRFWMAKLFDIEPQNPSIPYLFILLMSIIIKSLEEIDLPNKASLLNVLKNLRYLFLTYELKNVAQIGNLKDALLKGQTDYNAETGKIARDCSELLNFLSGTSFEHSTSDIWITLMTLLGNEFVSAQKPQFDKWRSTTTLIDFPTFQIVEKPKIDFLISGFTDAVTLEEYDKGFSINCGCKGMFCGETLVALPVKNCPNCRGPFTEQIPWSADVAPANSKFQQLFKLNSRFTSGSIIAPTPATSVSCCGGGGGGGIATSKSVVANKSASSVSPQRGVSCFGGSAVTKSALSGSISTDTNNDFESCMRVFLTEDLMKAVKLAKANFRTYDSYCQSGKRFNIFLHYRLVKHISKEGKKDIKMCW